MTEKIFETKYGVIHYWSNTLVPGKTTLVFLPGLTADHRLFDKQIEYFRDKLKNGEQVIISRKYVSMLRETLREGS